MPEVVTQHNDNARTGQNSNEQVLTTRSVKVAKFGRLFNRAVVGSIYGQPLYVPKVTIGGSTHNVVYIATMHNYVYAFDAEDPAARDPLWGPVALGPPIALPDPEIGPSGQYRDIKVEVGVLSTPVISMDKGAMYVVAATKEQHQYRHMLHALDLTSGHALAAPVEITASAPGRGDGGAEVAFASQRQIQRCGLLLLKNKIYIAFAAYGDRLPYHGWLLAYDADKLQQTGAFVTTPDGSGGGIWQAGQGPASDGNSIYVMTGNGTSTPGRNLSCAFIQINPDTLQVEHWFAPTNWLDLNSKDTDLGSGGPMALPNSDLIIGGGKDGRLFALKRNALGDAAEDAKAADLFQATERKDQGFTPADASGGYHHIHGSPVYWSRPEPSGAVRSRPEPSGAWIYLGGEADFLRAYKFTGASFEQPAASLSTVHTPAKSMPGAILSLSSDGSKAGSGILWASFPFAEDANTGSVEGVLYAFDASDLTKILWHSKQNPQRDDVGNFPKFCAPTISDGRVYLPSFSGIGQKVTLPEHAIGAPAVASSGPLLAVAWTGSDPAHHLNVESSADATIFRSKVTLQETSPSGPALAFGNRTFFLAWTNQDGTLSYKASPDPQNFGAKKNLGPESSPFAPALAFSSDSLFIAWTGTDALHLLNVGKVVGRKVVAKTTFADRSSDGPSLAFVNGKLYLTWIGPGNLQLNIKESPDNGATWGDTVIMAETSNFHPAFSAPSDLYLAWTGQDSRLNLSSSHIGADGFRSDPATQTYDDQSVAGPSVVTFQDRAYVTWTGTDPLRSVNVATITSGYLSAYGLR